MSRAHPRSRTFTIRSENWASAWKTSSASACKASPAHFPRRRPRRVSSTARRCCLHACVSLFPRLRRHSSLGSRIEGPYAGRRRGEKFTRTGTDQEAVLAAFEESHWPVKLDDPIHPCGKTLPKERLHNTIRRLNGCQGSNRIKFSVAGGGEAVRWAWLPKTVARKRKPRPRRQRACGKRNRGN